MNTRRELVIALGAGALTAPFGSFAQRQVKGWRIGVLGAGSPSGWAPMVEALRDGLRELGYVVKAILRRKNASLDKSRPPCLTELSTYGYVYELVF